MSVLGVDLSVWEAGKLFCRSGLLTIDHHILAIDRLLDGGSPIDRLYNDDRSVNIRSIVIITTIDRWLGQIASY